MAALGAAKAGDTPRCAVRAPAYAPATALPPFLASHFLDPALADVLLVEAAPFAAPAADVAVFPGAQIEAGREASPPSGGARSTPAAAWDGAESKARGGLPAHSLLLACGSPYFASMLASSAAAGLGGGAGGGAGGGFAEAAPGSRGPGPGRRLTLELPGGVGLGAAKRGLAFLYFGDAMLDGGDSSHGGSGGSGAAGLFPAVAAGAEGARELCEVLQLAAAWQLPRLVEESECRLAQLPSSAMDVVALLTHAEACGAHQLGDLALHRCRLHLASLEAAYGDEWAVGLSPQLKAAVLGEDGSEDEAPAGGWLETDDLL